MQQRSWIHRAFGAAFILLAVASQGALAQAVKSVNDVQDVDSSLVKAKVKHPRKVDSSPFLELLSKAQKMKDGGELDLSKPIEISVSADRNPTGSLRNVKIEQKQGDAKAKQLAGELVTLIDQSRALDFLEGSKPLRLTLRLDRTTVALSATTEVETKKRAAELAKVYSLLLYAGTIAKQGHDEEVIYKNTMVSAKDNQVNIKLQMARSKAGEILSKRLQ